jgi:hypothetical protein
VTRSAPAPAPCPPHQPAPPTPELPPIPESHLSEESRLLEAARSRLAARDGRGALEALSAGEARFPGGLLLEERRALLVEALALAGERARAHAEALRFAREHRTSPYASRVRAIDPGPEPGAERSDRPTPIP